MDGASTGKKVADADTGTSKKKGDTDTPDKAPKVKAQDGAEVAPKKKADGEAYEEGTGNKVDDFDANNESLMQKIDEANEAQSKSQIEYDALGNKYKKKTVAHDEIKTLSGWSDKPEGYTDVSPDKVKQYSGEICHEPSKAGAMDQKHNGGFDGKYNSSHAEKQLLTEKPNEPVGVSRPMCKDCQNFASKQAQATGKNVIVSDPDGVRIFKPDGSVQFIPH